mmetsp:Transcript_71570/g.186136  ORF Transcript_71570/g.186136 Transcript_71570/m.186136 type:complete len:227 (-) Transcript_71570:205-885(-)
MEARLLAQLRLREIDQRGTQNHREAHQHQHNDEARLRDLQEHRDDDAQQLRMPSHLCEPHHSEDAHEPDDANHAKGAHRVCSLVYMVVGLAGAQEQDKQVYIARKDGQEIDNIEAVRGKGTQAVTRIKPQGELNGEQSRDTHLDREKYRVHRELGHCLQDHAPSACQDDEENEVLDHPSGRAGIRILEQVVDVGPAGGLLIRASRSIGSQAACCVAVVVLHPIGRH